MLIVCWSSGLHCILLSQGNGSRRIRMQLKTSSPSERTSMETTSIPEISGTAKVLVTRTRRHNAGSLSIRRTGNSTRKSFSWSSPKNSSRSTIPRRPPPGKPTSPRHDHQQRTKPSLTRTLGSLKPPSSRNKSPARMSGGLQSRSLRKANRSWTRFRSYSQHVTTLQT